MRTLSVICSITLLVQLSCSDKPSLEELQRFTATETYPEDMFLDTVSNKRALIVVARDDDDCAISGTIARLTARGWKIKQLSLVKHSKKDGSNENPAGIIYLGNEAIVADGQYRIGLDTMKTLYLPIPYNEIEKQFLTDKVAARLTNKINTFNPSVLFTLDNIKGGYGHPEHVFY